MVRILRTSSLKTSNHFNQEIQRKLKLKKLTSIHESIVRNSLDIDKYAEWPINRGYKEYSAFFNYGINKHGLGKSIFDFLRKRFEKTKETVSVLDLGCGEGNFLSEIKQQLSSEKIPSKTESLSLVDNISEQNKSFIDKKNIMQATEHKLTKKYDLIVDLNGAINMELETIRKELLLKYSYSLKKGGVLVLNVIFNKSSSRLPSIINHLRKQGFNAAFYEKDSSPSSNYKYNTLIIERVK
jgi:SAM-dependent methyltransferase